MSIVCTEGDEGHCDSASRLVSVLLVRVCSLTGWQWAEQLMLAVRSRWKPLAGSRLRLHCLLWHKPSSPCSTSVWPGRNTPRSPNTHTGSRTGHMHREERSERHLTLKYRTLFFFFWLNVQQQSEPLNLKQTSSSAALTTLVSFARALVLWVGQEGPVQLGGFSLRNTQNHTWVSHTQKTHWLATLKHWAGLVDKKGFLC